MRLHASTCLFFVVVAVILLTAACTAEEPTPQLIALPTLTATGTPATPTATATPIPTAVIATLPPTVTPLPTPGPCSHLLWPLHEGAGWTYRLSDAAGSSDLTLMVSATDAGATLITSIGQMAVLYCGASALAGLPPLPVVHPDLGFGLKGLNPDGDYLPAAAMLLPLGQPVTWDQELEAAGSIVLPFSDVPLTVSSGKIVVISEAQTLTPINIPAGEFIALPVRQDVFLDIEVALPDGAPQHVVINTTTTAYFAEGVGLIKIIYTGGTVSTPNGAWPLASGAMLELLSFSIP